MAFWYQFWPAFAANVIAGPAVLLIAYAFIRWYRRPSLQVEAHLRGARNSQLEFEVMLRSVGRLNFSTNEVYWHIFVDAGLQIEKMTQEMEPDMQEIAGHLVKHFSGSVAGALFPDRPWGLMRFIVTKPSNGTFNLYYFVSTAYGQFPRYLRRLKSGEDRLRNLPCFAQVTSGGLLSGVADRGTVSAG